MRATLDANGKMEKLELLPYQIEGVEFLVGRKRALLASDPGTGKTIMNIKAVDAISRGMGGREVGAGVLVGTSKNSNSAALDVLVLCPKSVMISWEREIKKWSDSITNWTIINWDKLVYPNHVDRVKKKWDIIIGDESHTALKNPEAIRCRVFIDELLPFTKRVWLATATPASKSGLDYYPTLEVLLPSLLKKWTPYKFKVEFCNAVPCAFTPGGYKYEGFRNTHILKEIFSKVALRHKKDEVLKELPDKIYTDLYVQVSGKTVAANLELDEQYVAKLIQEGQPLPGHIAHVMQANALAKLDSAVEWIENFSENESLVIFAWHSITIDSINAALTKSASDSSLIPLVITGQTAEKKRQEYIDLFQSGKRKRIICNMVAGGLGITLTAAQTALYIEFPFSPTHWLQSQDRIHRIGTKSNHVHIIKMIGLGTVDEAIWRVLSNRVRETSEILR